MADHRFHTHSGAIMLRPSVSTVCIGTKTQKACK